MKDKILDKLYEIRIEVTNLVTDNSDLSHGEYNNLLKRVIFLSDKAFGEKNEYSESLLRIDKTYSSVLSYSRTILAIKGVLDLIIDDLELQQQKEEVIEIPKQEFLKKELRNKTIQDLNKKVFIVHGHADTIRESLARTLEKLGLEAIILSEQPNSGDSILDKLHRNSNVGFAIVILSADDYGRNKNKPESENKYRARQNVIFELGYFIAKLGKKNVIALLEQEKDFEIPSDYNGIVYIPFHRNNNEWKFRVASELREAGYQIDANNILN